ncbi:MAG: hypothetical protein OS112_02825 [Methanoregula sp.]|nr:MAG: hypothetical protein OS112_02825 [Methanoregula sp.]
MDNLVKYGVIAVVLFYLSITAIAAGVLYGLYILALAYVTGNFAKVLEFLPPVVTFALAYGLTGLALKKLGII